MRPFELACIVWGASSDFNKSYEIRCQVMFNEYVVCEHASSHQSVDSNMQSSRFASSPSGNGAHGLLEVHEFFKPCAGFDKGDCNLAGMVHQRCTK